VKSRRIAFFLLSDPLFLPPPSPSTQRGASSPQHFPIGLAAAVSTGLVVVVIVGGSGADKMLQPKQTCGSVVEEVAQAELFSRAARSLSPFST
jgi:hypothetical protein